MPEVENVEQEEQEAVEPAESQPSLDELSEEQLRELIDNPDEPLEIEPAAEEEVGEQEIQEPEPVEAVEEPPEEVQAVEETAEVQTSETEIPLEQIQRELEDTRRQREHFEKLAGSQAGRSGHLEQQVKQLQETIDNLNRRMSTPTRDDAGYPDDTPPAAGVDQAVLDRLQLISRRVNTMAMAASVQELNRKYPDLQEYNEQIGEMVKTEEFSSLFEAEDPNEVATRTSHMVEGVYWASRDAKLTKMAEEAEARKGSQAESLRARKLDASPASASAAPARTRVKPKTPDELSVEELAALIDARADARAKGL